MPTALTPDQLQQALALRDLTDPEAGSHALQMLVDVAVGALARTWRYDVRPHRGPASSRWATTTTGSATGLRTSPVRRATPDTSMTATCSAAIPAP